MKHMKFTLTAVLGLFIVGGLSAQITIDTSIPSPGAGSVLGDASGDGVASWQAASGSGSGSGFWEGSQTGSINNTNSGNINVNSLLSCGYVETNERITRTGYAGTGITFGGADLSMRTAGANTLACYNGYVGVNGYPSTSGAKLQVNGSCQATEFISGTTTYPDYVFEDDYKLMPLDELAAFIAEEGHLPKIATEKEVEAFGGVKLGELQIQLLEKVEELTLYTLQQEERIKAQQEAYDALKAQVESLQNN